MYAIRYIYDILCGSRKGFTRDNWLTFSRVVLLNYCDIVHDDDDDSAKRIVRAVAAVN